MSAYVISEVEIVDPIHVETYRSLAAAAIAHYGGRYLARGGAIEAVEGDWAPERIIIVESPSMERARAWYHSPEYAEALQVRPKALNRRLIFVDGMPPAQNTDLNIGY
jgi:uncharacterized protein (DUF1330 family)